MKKILLLISLFITGLIGAQSIDFNVVNLKAGPADCNFMFQWDDDPGMHVDDGNPFTGVHDPYYANNYAYRNFTWSVDVGHLSSSTCTNEDLAVIAGTAGVTLKLYGFSLQAFNHINTVNANNNWDIRGEAGDERIYAGGIGEIYVGEDLKLTVTNCRLSVGTPYPTKDQANFILKALKFDDNIGTGLEVSGGGWGTIDEVHSDAAWVSNLDPNGTGQLEYQLSTVSTIIQDNYGYFNFNIRVIPTAFRENMDCDSLGAKSSTLNLSNAKASFLFADGEVADYGGKKTVYANQIMTNPGGANPDGINSISPHMYWQLGTTLKTFTTDVTFDITGLPGVTDYSKLRILKRNNSSATWSIWADYTLVDNNHIRANNLTSFSEFGIGTTTNDNPFPVELTSFNASFGKNKVQLNWATATELNNYGFEIERSFDKTNWNKIAFVEGNGNSNSVKNYNYIDKNVSINGNYYYRLKQVDNNGDFEYSNVIEVTVNNIPSKFEVSQNYPNPFNPSTKISYGLPEAANVRLSIFNAIGQEVFSLNEGFKEPGSHSIEFNGSELNSGIYFYKLEAGNNSQIKKMLLIK